MSSKPNSIIELNEEGVKHDRKSHWAELRSFTPEEREKCQSHALRHPPFFSYKKTAMVTMMVIEWIASVCFGMYICACGVLITMDIRGYLEYPCGFQCYLCFGSFLLYPLLLLCSLWKRIIGVTMYGFLVLGILFLMSGIWILASCFIHFGVHDTFIYIACGGAPLSDYDRIRFMMLVAIWGIDIIIRYWCCSRYVHVLFSFALFRSYHQSLRDFWRLSVGLGIYITVYVVGW